KRFLEFPPWCPEFTEIRRTAHRYVRCSDPRPAQAGTSTARARPGLDLQLRKIDADARPRAAAKRCQRVRVPPVFLARRREAIRVEDLLSSRQPVLAEHSTHQYDSSSGNVA